MARPLEGKVALVTGASRGIGRAIAERLAADGALVAVHYGSNRGAADETVGSIEAAGGKAFAVGANLAASDGVTTLYAALDKELQARNGSTALDILVNNAGIAPFVSFEDTTEEVLDEIYAVNVRSVFFISQQGAKRLRDGGRIVNISSGVVRTPFVDVAAYSALKAPLDNLTKTLAVLLGPRGITVNAVSPGAIETDMGAFLKDPAVAEGIKSKQALKRIGQAEDIADVVGFLAGLESRWVTGQVIEASGGSALTF
ncbi:short-chain dehydrogenase [Hyphomicrobium nitrativorans NL23]|uniref:Short-chain dehydrogenase n=1 Tax=Hyphomicrobium nitrativorans NL23 TaxID=1029756 RepID=V5SBX9_9HYPH|nr:SDR family oxidoreductase [Hyphomicrobium nitrativorans]AHB47479.1 short-chain dehydrogenase [Hyphomicrobium nitrativorans NL23]